MWVNLIVLLLGLNAFTVLGRVGQQRGKIQYHLRYTLNQVVSLLGFFFFKFVLFQEKRKQKPVVNLVFSFRT